jgi:hypothetical protein
METGDSSIRMSDYTSVDWNILDFMFFSLMSSVLSSHLMADFNILVWDLFSPLDWDLYFTDYILVFSPFIRHIKFDLMRHLDLLFNRDVFNIGFIDIVSHSSRVHFSDLLGDLFDSLGLEIIDLLLLSVLSPLLWDHFSVSLVDIVYYLVSPHNGDLVSDSFNSVVAQYLFLDWDFL